MAYVSFLSSLLRYASTMHPFRALAPILLLFPLAAPAPGHAFAEEAHAERDHDGVDLSRDALRRLVQQGKLLPLTVLRSRVLERTPGELINVSVDREDGHILYEFRILTSGGKVTEVELDAATGKIIEIENE